MLLPKPSPNLPASCFAVGTRHSGLWVSFGVLETQTLPDASKSVRDDNLSDRITPFSRLMFAFYGRDTSVTRGLAIAAEPTVFVLMSACFCGNMLYKMNAEFCSHLLYGGSVTFRNNLSQCTMLLSVPDFLSSSGSKTGSTEPL
jgi:hypothetical protein